jgi:hypothetical protein
LPKALKSSLKLVFKGLFQTATGFLTERPDLRLINGAKITNNADLHQCDRSAKASPEKL